MVRRIMKWLAGAYLACVAIGLVIGLVLYAGRYGYLYQQFRAELDIYRELGYPTNMDELRAWDAVDDPELNAAEPIYEAFDKLNFDYSNDLLLPVSGIKEIDIGPTERYSEEVIRDIGIVLDLNREALDLIHASTGLKKYRPEVSDVASLDRFPALASLRVSARLLKEEMYYRAQTGGMDEGIHSIEAIFWLCTMFRQYPDVISLLVTNAVEGIGVSAAVDAMNRYDLTEPQIGRLLEIMSSVEKNRIYERSFIGEPILMTDLMGDISYETLIEQDFPLAWHKAVAFYDVTKYRMERRLSLSLPELLRASYRVNRQIVDALEYESWHEIPEELLSNEYLKLLKDNDYVSVVKIARILFESRAKVTSVIVGLHVERYRLKYGRLPETLNDLVPEFMESVPRGLFVDEPIGYEIDDEGYVVYAVAESRVEEVKAKAYSVDCDCLRLNRYGFRRYLRTFFE